MPVRWSKEKGFYAENLFVVECEDAGDLEGVLDEGKHYLFIFHGDRQNCSPISLYTAINSVQSKDFYNS